METSIKTIVQILKATLRVGVAKHNNDLHELVVGTAEKIPYTILKYNVFKISSPDGNPLSRKTPFIVVSKRTKLSPEEKIVCYRLTNDVFLEAENEK